MRSSRHFFSFSYFSFPSLCSTLSRQDYGRSCWSSKFYWFCASLVFHSWIRESSVECCRNWDLRAWQSVRCRKLAYRRCIWRMQLSVCRGIRQVMCRFAGVHAGGNARCDEGRDHRSIGEHRLSHDFGQHVSSGGWKSQLSPDRTECRDCDR